MAEVFADLLRINLAVACAVAVVMAARLPVRRLFGARVAYGLWSLPPLAVLAMLVPARTLTVRVPAARLDMIDAPIAAEAASGRAPVDAGPMLAGLWLLGAAASLAWLAWRQAQFARAARAGTAGPAVVGVLRPRVVIPADFDQRYTPREQEVVLAHERTHLARRDPPVNALVALAACVNWFNPAVHVMGRWLRIDQELACDARVVAAYPKARRAYAEAMLKTQLAARPLPLGCHWSSHSLAHRVRLISRPAPGRARRLVGVACTVLLGAGGASAVWAARPPEVVMATEQTIAERMGPPRPPIPPRPPGPPRRPVPPSSPAWKSAGRLPGAAPIPTAAAIPPIPEAPAEQIRQAPSGSPIPPPDIRRLRIIHAVADRSQVQPGSAVRVVASTLSPDGAPLWADFTAFGSQRIFRKGAYERGGSRYSLFTSVVQDGERLKVTVSLGRQFRPELTGSIELAPGQTGVVKLPTGQDVVVTATVRPETPDEVEEGRQLTAYRDYFEGLRRRDSDERLG